MEFDGPKYLVVAGKNRLFPQLGGVSAKLVSRQERFYPIDLGNGNERIEEVQIKIPPNFKLSHLPPGVNIETDWFSYTNSYTFEDGVITFIERRVNKKRRVGVSQYPEFKRIYESLARDTENQAILTESSRQSS